MKIAICYPPMPSECGVPLLSQNRQFQWFAQPTYIYPVVPAQAATMLKKGGHEVVWLDGIASEWTPERFEQELIQSKPDIIFAETKTPVVKRHWSWFTRCRQLFPKARLVIAGDHVTARPAETMEQAPVDYVLTGGDYDFLLCNLVRHLTQSEPLEPGIWHREGGEVVNTGAFKLDHDLDA
ncbi:MAG: B12-binding domain-containing radical SAM protein, partial [Kiritimatiellia bacterium]